MPLLAKPALMFLVEAAATTLSDLCGHPEGRTYAPVFQALAGLKTPRKDREVSDPQSTVNQEAAAL
jgi:hypothetical protein